MAIQSRYSHPEVLGALFPMMLCKGGWILALCCPSACRWAGLYEALRLDGGCAGRGRTLCTHSWVFHLSVRARHGIFWCSDPTSPQRLRNYIALAPFHLHLSLILDKEKCATAQQLFWELEGSVLGWLQSSLWQIFDHSTEWELESISPDLPLLSLLLWYVGKARRCASPVTCIWSLRFKEWLPHSWLEICWYIGCKIEMAECVVLSGFGKAAAPASAETTDPWGDEILRLLIPASIFSRREWQHLQVTKLSETGCLSWVLRRRERTLLKNSIKN